VFKPHGLMRSSLADVRSSGMVLRSSTFPYRFQDIFFGKFYLYVWEITCVFPLVPKSAINIKTMQYSRLNRGYPIYFSKCSLEVRKSKSKKPSFSSSLVKTKILFSRFYLHLSEREKGNLQRSEILCSGTRPSKLQNSQFPETKNEESLHFLLLE
jgi:hypothetical protein